MLTGWIDFDQTLRALDRAAPPISFVTGRCLVPGANAPLREDPVARAI
jgi:hypothetical protein